MVFATQDKEQAKQNLFRTVWVTKRASGLPPMVSGVKPASAINDADVRIAIGAPTSPEQDQELFQNKKIITTSRLREAMARADEMGVSRRSTFQSALEQGYKIQGRDTFMKKKIAEQRKIEPQEDNPIESKIEKIQNKPARQRTKQEQEQLQAYRNQQFFEDFNLGTNFSTLGSDLFGTKDVSEDISRGDYVEVLKKAGRNIPASTLNIAGSIADMVLNPGQTLGALTTLFLGSIDASVWADTPEAETVKELAMVLGDTISDPNKIIEFAAEDPVGVITMISPKSVGSVGNKVLSVAGRTFGKPTRAILGKTTGAGSQSLEEAIKSAGDRGFVRALRGQTSTEDVLRDVKRALENIRSSAKSIYGEDYEKLARNTDVLDISDIRKDFVSEITSKDGLNIKINKDGNFDFSRSTITDAATRNDIKSMYQDIAGRDLEDAVGVDILKKRIQDYYRGTPASAQSDRLSTIYTNKIKQKISDKIPEYEQMNIKYGEYKKLMNEVSKGLSIDNRKSQNTAITKLQQVMKDNKEHQKALVKSIEELAGENITQQLAGLQLNPLMARGIIWPLIASPIAIWTITSVLTPQFLALLPGFSPRLVGEVANAIGVSQKALMKAAKTAADMEAARLGIGLNVLEQEQ